MNPVTPAYGKLAGSSGHPPEESRLFYGAKLKHQVFAQGSSILFVYPQLVQASERFEMNLFWMGFRGFEQNPLFLSLYFFGPVPLMGLAVGRVLFSFCKQDFLLIEMATAK